MNVILGFDSQDPLLKLFLGGVHVFTWIDWCLVAPGGKRVVTVVAQLVERIKCRGFKSHSQYFNEGNDVMKTILNVTKENDTISVHVDKDVTTEELEYGLINVIYHLIIRDMRVQGMRMNRNNFNQMNRKYGESVKVQTGVMWDLIHEK